MDSPVSEDRSPNQPHPPTTIGGETMNSFAVPHHYEFENGNAGVDHHQRPHATSVGMASSHGSSHESEDSNNGFVKLEHPTDLLGDFGYPSDAGTHLPAFHRDEQHDFHHLQHDRPEITPSDEISPLSAGDTDDMMASSPAHMEGKTNDAFDNEHKDDPFVTQTGHEITEVADAVHDKAERLVEEIFDAPKDTDPDAPAAQPDDGSRTGFGRENNFRVEHHGSDHIDPVSPSGDSGRDVIGDMMGSGDNSPMGGGGDYRGTSPDERTYERDGPLTFGQHHSAGAAVATDSFIDRHHQPVDDPFTETGFGSEPRLPTPPMEHNDHSPVKPFADLGPFSHTAHVSPPSEPSKPYVRTTHGGDQGSGPWVDFKSVDHRVLDLIYWRDPRKSAVALVATLALLICLATFSFVTVVSYAGLTLLAVTLSFRVYKTVLAQIQKTDATNPFQPYLEKDLTLPQERVHQQVDVLLEHGQQVARQLRRLFLVEDIVDTVKFGLLLWALTYVGACFSGLTLVILALLGVFTIPKFYEVYKEPIDKNLAVVKGHVDKTSGMVQEKLPFLKKKTQ